MDDWLQKIIGDQYCGFLPECKHKGPGPEGKEQVTYCHKVGSRFGWPCSKRCEHPEK